MAKKKKKRGTRKFTIPIAPIVGLAAGFVGPVGDSPYEYLMKSDYHSALVRLAKNYTGYDANTGKWEPYLMMSGLVPLVIGCIIHKFVGGAPLNVNRMLAAANVPVIRI